MCHRYLGFSSPFSNMYFQILIFSLFASSHALKGSSGCDPQDSDCQTPPAVPDSSVMTGSSSSLNSLSFSASAPSTNFVQPIPPENVPGPTEFDMFDSSGAIQFMGSPGSSVMGGESYDDWLRGQGSLVTTTPPPYSTITITWTNQPTFNVSLGLFAYTPDLTGADSIRADGPFMRELRRRLTT